MSARERPWAGRRLHFVGVGGSGMSGYARVAHALGATVSGSDNADSPYLQRLREEGVLNASVGHAAANLPAGEGVELVYSSAVPVENPERAAARERGLPEHPRADLLGELSAMRRTIAVAGTHGKTTTSSMIAHALLAAGMSPGWLIGAPIGVGLPNANWGEGDWLVVEADESDRSMLSLHVEIAVLTNVELDHHATFASLAELREAFRELLAHARRAVVVWDRPELRELIDREEPIDRAVRVDPAEPHSAVRPSQPSGQTPPDVEVVSPDVEVVYYDATAPTLLPGGDIEVVHYDAPAPTLLPGGSRFRWREHEVTLSVPGAHNAVNAAGALEAVLASGADPVRAIPGVERFTGAGRRFQRVGATARGAVVIDDYAHHPTEVAATIAAARTFAFKRLVAVFQPHLYSRTAMLSNEFGAALARADVIVLLDVYAARERGEDHPGISGLTLARAAAEQAGGRQVLWLPDLDVARGVLEDMLDAGDLCVVMGAGDVDQLARSLAA